MSKSSKTTRKRHDWVKIRAAYRKLPTSVSLTEFAAKMQVPLRTLQSHMKKDGEGGDPWERDLSGAVRDETKKLQQRVAAGLDKHTPITDEQLGIVTAAATNVLVLEAHGDLMALSRELIRDGMKLLKAQVDKGTLIIQNRAKADDAPPTEEIDVSAEYVGKSLKNFTASLKETVAMERHHLGLDDEDGNDNYEDDLDALLDELEDDEEQDGEVDT